MATHPRKNARDHQRQALLTFLISETFSKKSIRILLTYVDGCYLSCSTVRTPCDLSRKPLPRAKCPSGMSTCSHLSRASRLSGSSLGKTLAYLTPARTWKQWLLGDMLDDAEGKRAEEAEWLLCFLEDEHTLSQILASMPGRIERSAEMPKDLDRDARERRRTEAKAASALCMAMKLARFSVRQREERRRSRDDKRSQRYNMLFERLQYTAVALLDVYAEEAGRATRQRQDGEFITNVLFTADGREALRLAFNIDAKHLFRMQPSLQEFTRHVLWQGKRNDFVSVSGNISAVIWTVIQIPLLFVIAVCVRARAHHALTP